jgi:signal transduction histidine kinase
MPSIETRLKGRLLLGSVALSVALALTAWWWVGRQVRDLLDYQLEQVARTLVDHDFGAADEGSEEDPAMHLVVVAWDGEGRLLYRSSPELELRPDAPAGFSRMRSGSQEDAVTLRVFTLRARGRVIQVAHPQALRQELARDAGLEILAPALAGTAALSLLIVFTVRRSLAPLRDLGQEVARRDAQSLAPIELPHAPAELHPALTTLNALLERLQASLTLHRQFIADAAHELRTPLAAVRVQADNVVRALDAQQREAAMTQLSGGIERLQHLVEQLLELARLESSPALRRARVDLAGIARDCLVEHATEAAARRMELALEVQGESWLDGDARAVRSLLDNLVGNALKYAAAGTAVVVAISREPSCLCLSVRDHGPGIDAGARERMLERFRRGEHGATGSGLGLAIAAEAARRHGARLELRTPAAGPGLEARVAFPLGSA